MKVREKIIAIKLEDDNKRLREALEACLKWMEFTIPRLHTTPSGSIERMNWGGPIHKARVALGLQKPMPEMSDAERNAP